MNYEVSFKKLMTNKNKVFYQFICDKNTQIDLLKMSVIFSIIMLITTLLFSNSSLIGDWVDAKTRNLPLLQTLWTSFFYVLFIWFVILLVFRVVIFVVDCIFFLIFKILYKDDYQKIMTIRENMKLVDMNFSSHKNKEYKLYDMFDKKGNLLNKGKRKKIELDFECKYIPAQNDEELKYYTISLVDEYTTTTHLNNYYKIQYEPNVYITLVNEKDECLKNKQYYSINLENSYQKEDKALCDKKQIIKEVHYNPNFYKYDEVNNRLILKE